MAFSTMTHQKQLQSGFSLMSRYIVYILTEKGNPFLEQREYLSVLNSNIVVKSGPEVASIMKNVETIGTKQYDTFVTELKNYW